MRRIQYLAPVADSIQLSTEQIMLDLSNFGNQNEPGQGFGGEGEDPIIDLGDF